MAAWGKGWSRCRTTDDDTGRRSDARHTSRRRPGLGARRGLRHTAVVGALGLALSACGSSGGARQAELDPSLGDESCEFTYATTVDVDPGQIADLAALDGMRDAGCLIEMETLAESELLAEGVIQDRYQIAGIGSPPFFLLVQQEQPVVMLMERNGNDWALVGETGIEDCQDVADAGSLGISSRGGVAGAIGGYWFKEDCPDLEVPYVSVPGGPERAQALLAGEIATSVQSLSDVAVLLEEAPDQLTEIANFSEVMPQLITYAMISNTGWVEENPNTVKMFMRLKLEEHRKLVGDPAYVEEMLRKYEAQVEEEHFDAVVDIYSSPDLWDPNGGASEEDLQFTIDLFRDGGAIEPEPEIETLGLVARDLLNEVLDEIGRE